MRAQECELQNGLKFSVNVPSSVEEFDGLPGGRPGLCLECGIDDVLYRGAYATARDLLAEAVEKANPEIPRNRKPHSNKERAARGETVYDESPNRYIARVASELNLDFEDGSYVNTFQPILDQIMARNAEIIQKIADGTATVEEKKDLIEFSVEKVARTGGGGFVGKGDLAQAKEWIDAGADALAVGIQNLSAALGLEKPFELSGDEGQQQRQLAIKMKEYRNMLSKNAFAGMAKKG